MSVAPVRVMTLWVSCAFTARAKRQPNVRRFEESMIVVSASVSPLRAFHQPAAQAIVYNLDMGEEGEWDY